MGDYKPARTSQDLTGPHRTLQDLTGPGGPGPWPGPMVAKWPWRPFRGSFRGLFWWLLGGIEVVYLTTAKGEL